MLGQIAESISTALPAPGGERAPSSVLVVDDVPEILDCFRRVASKLKGLPIALTLEPDPGRAVLLCRETPFDLVVSDLTMPGIDGIQVLAAAKRANPGGLRFLMTGYDEIPRAPEVLLSAGVDGYLKKPILVEDLLAFFKRALAMDGRFLAESRREARRFDRG